MSRFLKNFAEFLDEQPFDIIRATEIHDGKRETLERIRANYCQNTYSVAKFFTMTAIGLLVDDGKLSVKDKITDIFADELPKNIDERWDITTVSTCLTHKIGLPGGFLDIDCQKSSEFSEDYLKYMFEYPLLYTPETDRKYTDGAYYLLARVVEKITGDNVEDFLWKKILFQMDFQEIAWSHCPKGYSMGGTGLYIGSPDMAKMGQLYLNGGVYNGVHLLSENRVKTSIENRYAIDSDPDEIIFFKGGMYGQKLIFCPSQNRVLAIQSYDANGDLMAKFLINYKEE